MALPAGRRIKGSQRTLENVERLSARGLTTPDDLHRHLGCHKSNDTGTNTSNGQTKHWKPHSNSATSDSRQWGDAAIRLPANEHFARLILKIDPDLSGKQNFAKPCNSPQNSPQKGAANGCGKRTIPLLLREFPLQLLTPDFHLIKSSRTGRKGTAGAASRIIASCRAVHVCEILEARANGSILTGVNTAPANLNY